VVDRAAAGAAAKATRTGPASVRQAPPGRAGTGRAPVRPLVRREHRSGDIRLFADVVSLT